MNLEQLLIKCQLFVVHAKIFSVYIFMKKLNFPNHIEEKISKANKGISILRKLYNVYIKIA